MNFENKDGVYFENQIFVFNNHGTKCLTIHVYLTTGVILIKGLSHKEWATYEFPKVLDLINESISEETNLPTTEFLDSINDMKSHTKSNNNRKSNDHATTNRNDGTQDETDEDDLFSSVESLWEENAKLRTSLNSLDSNFGEISKTLNQIREDI